MAIVDVATVKTVSSVPECGLYGLNINDLTFSPMKFCKMQQSEWKFVFCFVVPQMFLNLVVCFPFPPPSTSVAAVARVIGFPAKTQSYPVWLDAAT